MTDAPDEPEGIDHLRAELEAMHDPEAAVLSELAQAIATIRTQSAPKLDRDAIWAAVEKHFDQLDPSLPSEEPDA